VELGHPRGRLDDLGILIAVPAAWSMAFVPSKRTKDILLWMLSTKMLPAVGVLYPIYLMFIQLGLLDTRDRTGRRPDADQPADHRLDALHLFQGNPGRDPGSRADGRRGTARGDPLRADADGDPGHRLDHAC
jgi:hypothetical protein